MKIIIVGLLIAILYIVIGVLLGHAFKEAMEFESDVIYPLFEFLWPLLVVMLGISFIVFSIIETIKDIFNCIRRKK